ncbi:MAG: TPM domain-containing protein [Candidatus Omnitrophota bacterium]
MIKRLFSSGILVLLLIGVFSSLSWAKDSSQLPSPLGYVNDFAKVINPADWQAINTFATELESKTTAQIAVVTVETTQPETIEGYAVKLFKKWGIGQKGKNNGILFLIASQDHKLRIEVGYGLEGVITDAISSQIINQIVVPAFKQGQISNGVLQGSKAIISLIAKEANVSITGQETAMYSRVHADNSGRWLIVLVFILFFIFSASSFGRTGVGGYGYYGGGGGGGFGGGSSGGFGGFGGGMSGGGGGSGSW